MLRLVKNTDEYMPVSEELYGKIEEATGVELDLFKQDLKRFHKVGNEVAHFDYIFMTVWKAYYNTDWNTVSSVFSLIWG